MDSPSPELKPICPKLNLSRSPSPDIPRDQIGPNGTSQATGGVGMLLRHLGNGWNPPEISLEAARESLLRDEDSLSEEPRREGAVDGNLASGALLNKDPFVSRYISGNTVTSPRIPSSNESLSPLYHGVRAPAGEPPSRSLPSFRSTFGELRDLPPERLSEQDLGRARPGPSSTFPNSRAGSLGHKTTNLPSSPHSPPDGYRASLPCSTAGMSWHHCPANGNHPRAPTAYSSSNSGETPNTDHTNSTPAISTRVNSTSVADRMSIDGIAGSYTCTVHGCNAAPFQTQYLLNSHMNVHSSIRPHYCPVKGCPRSEGGKGFKRKNEMIRHGLVHDSPGYVCPFCPDREHKYPRPDNLQRYVNLLGHIGASARYDPRTQVMMLTAPRHVRVHHIDKDKDDPQLRDVLAQRPDGPNRDRRSRNPPS